MDIEIVSSMDKNDKILLSLNLLYKYEQDYSKRFGKNIVTNNLIHNIISEFPNQKKIEVSLKNVKDIKVFFERGAWPSNSKIRLIGNERGGLKMVSDYLGIIHQVEAKIKEKKKKRKIEKRNEEKFENDDYGSPYEYNSEEEQLKHEFREAWEAGDMQVSEEELSDDQEYEISEHENY